MFYKILTKNLWLRLGSISLVSLVIATGTFILFDYLRPGVTISNDGSGRPGAVGEEKNLKERIRVAEERAQSVKGVYMTSGVANDAGRAATKLRSDIIKLLETTELNGVVIDVKETEGGLIVTNGLEKLVGELHEKGIWVIARQAVFKDSSQEKINPQWYLKRKNGAIWRDRRGGSWLDPDSKEVWSYTLAAAKAASDAGFDEIQFDYIRFPSDGNTADIVYPFYRITRPKYEVLREFFSYAHSELKAHRPELIISADLFGYVALESADLGIGQRLQDIGENFDYVSLMVYPSHYYSGFGVEADPQRNLAAVFYPYKSKDISKAAASNPYNVVYRTLLIAGDILEGRVATATAQIDESFRPKSELGAIGKAATSPISPPSLISSTSSPRRARLRPWLQSFDLGADSSRGIYYDAGKVRAQIDAAEAAGASGWLLWSPNNIYTREALKSG
ncbi:MAG: hypothetical protein HYT42_00310 [Candidatus Sungbacteria bacterium]|nr:hypothetical protein [Candidatus Sungbacteria bacterium]